MTRLRTPFGNPARARISTIAQEQPGTGAVPNPRMRLGIVTYNIAKDWSIEEIIKHCEETGFEGVELRTSHAHGVEVSLNAAQRTDVKKRFQNTKVALMGLGSAFEYQTVDAAKLRQDIEATKQYILLAQDVGAPGVKVRPNGLPKEVPVDKTLAQIGRSLREIGQFGQEHGHLVCEPSVTRSPRLHRR